MDATLEKLFPFLAFFFVFGLPVLAFIIHRVLVHQERMEMLRHGIVPPPNRPEMRRAKSFAESGGWEAPDAAAHIPYGYEGYVAAQRHLRKGVNLAMIGLALLIGLSFIEPGHVGPWLLGGLIPLFVGIAQIFIAILSGAQLGALRPPVAPLGAPPAGRPSRPSAPGPYAYRPGSTTELESPVSPPDVQR
ncbi:MAG: hypothetical protein NVS1B14_05290 [Vulcanimicrobiaceae bacterium]